MFEKQRDWWGYPGRYGEEGEEEGLVLEYSSSWMMMMMIMCNGCDQQQLELLLMILMTMMAFIIVIMMMMLTSMMITKAMVVMMTTLNLRQTVNSPLLELSWPILVSILQHFALYTRISKYSVEEEKKSDKRHQSCTSKPVQEASLSCKFGFCKQILSKVF